MASITCGHCHGTHTAAAIVRACHQGARIIVCTWLVETRIEGELYVSECGAEAWYDSDRFECANGHSHVNTEARLREGWDYAEDAYDAAVISLGGRTYRPMTAATGIDEREVARVMSEIR